jgi:hypothetical protein
MELALSTLRTTLILPATQERGKLPKASIVEEVRGMIPEDRARPCDLVVLDFAEGGRHLIIDGVVTTVYRNSVLPNKVAAIPGFAVKHVC